MHHFVSGKVLTHRMQAATGDEQLLFAPPMAAIFRLSELLDFELTVSRKSPSRHSALLYPYPEYNISYSGPNSFNSAT
jgi:hypothetical protein